MKRTVISQSNKRRQCPKDSGNCVYMEQVVYKGMGTSITKHEVIKDQYAHERKLQAKD